MKKGDKVIITTGKDKKKSGTITKIFPKKGLVVVSGVNIKKRHSRPKKTGQKGSIIDIESPIHISNIKLDK
jgi:large subunit ribosomal protein L24